MNLGIFGLAVRTRRRRGAEMAAVPKRGLPPVAVAVALSLIVGTASLEQTSFYGRLIIVTAERFWFW